MLGRRAFLGGAAALVGARPALATPPTGFTHGVASGEPQTSGVLLWTRHVGADGARLTAEVSDTPGFARIVAGGEARASGAADWTARVTVGGLRPGQDYWYRWRAPDGAASPTGRTRTLPDGGDRLRLGVFSCSNLPFGHFNAYAHAAARDDLDLAVHLGDYLYEYPAGVYPDASGVVAGRRSEPSGLLVHLADYRARYARYRRDPDLAALHARLPWAAVWDDHEFADNAHRDGAWEHDPAKLGPWAARRAAAAQAWAEWMPVSRAEPSAVDAGDLATLIRLETRVTGRTPAPDFYRVGGDERALARWRDTQWAAGPQRILGVEQENWLTAELARAARRTRWQLLIQPVPMGLSYLPPEALRWTAAGGEEGRREAALLVAAGRVGVPMNMDNWNGYPAQRGRVLAAAQTAGANLVVLSGDSHNAWAFQLRHDSRPAAVEFAAQSVTSPGFERWFPAERPEAVARALVAASSELRWAETARRGYMTVTLTREEARAEWLFFASVARREVRPSDRAVLRTVRGMPEPVGVA